MRQFSHRLREKSRTTPLDQGCRRLWGKLSQKRHPRSCHPMAAQFSHKLCENLWRLFLGGHHVLMLGKIKSPPGLLFYLRATAQFGWSRNVLLNQIKAGAYERAVTEKKTHNFPLALPDYLAEQADDLFTPSPSHLRILPHFPLTVYRMCGNFRTLTRQDQINEGDHGTIHAGRT